MLGKLHTAESELTGLFSVGVLTPRAPEPFHRILNLSRVSVNGRDIKVERFPLGCLSPLSVRLCPAMRLQQVGELFVQLV